MKVQHGALAGLGMVLVLVAFYFLLYRPAGDEIVAAEAAAQVARDQQAEQQQRIRALEQARTEAPDVEALLATARSVIPDEVAMPSALRQVQDAADGAGIEIMALTPSTAQPWPADPTLSQVAVSMQVKGSYFQVVDFVRRIEDPRLTARAMVGDFIVLSTETYPTLTVDLSMRMFARTPVSPGAVEDPAAGEAGTADTPAPPAADAPAGDAPAPAPADGGEDVNVEAAAQGGVS